MATPEVLEATNALRQKIASGNYTIDDVRQAVAIMREGRTAAAAASSTSRTKKATAKASAAPVDTGKLFDDLENL